MIKVYGLEITSVGENTYALVNENNEALIVDPGGQADRIIAWIDDHVWSPQAVILTHAHLDHIGALDAIRDHYQIEAYVHYLEKDFMENPILNLSALMGMRLVQRPCQHHWQEMGAQTIGNFSFETRHVPGHSPGSVVYIFAEDQFVISGDTVFQGSIGRTDFPGGSYQQLIQGIQTHLLSLPDQFTLYPGHGPATKVGIEKISNPFLQ